MLLQAYIARGTGRKPIPYTRANKHIHLFLKLQGNMRLISNMRLIMKLTTPPKLYMTAKSAGKKNPKALRVDLMFTVESPKSVSCDAMTNVGSCLEENSYVDEESSHGDRRYCIVEIR